MSDYDKVKELFTDLGLQPSFSWLPILGKRCITLDEDCIKVEAHAGFFASFRFTKDGSFLELSIKE